MNKDILKGKWLQVKGDVCNSWGKLTERYGYGREQAEKELNDFLSMPDNERRRSA